MTTPVLVTGGCGYIGSHVVRQLHEAGRTVVVLDNLSTGVPEALVHQETLVVADLSEPGCLESLFERYRFKTVLHFAASIVAPASVEQPLVYYGNNTRNTLRLLEVAVRYGLEQLIFSSTAAVYGLPPGGRAGENSPTEPINPYGSSKLMSEWMIRDAAAAHHFRYVALRYFNVAGADPQARMGQRTPEATHLIKVACQAALGIRSGVALYGTDYDTPDGTGIRDYIHIEDLASAHLAALRYLDHGGASAVMNVGYGQGSSVREVLDVVHRVTGVPFPVTEEPRRPGDPSCLVAQTDRIHALTGWVPRYDRLETIVADAWRWEQQLFKQRS